VLDELDGTFRTQGKYQKKKKAFKLLIGIPEKKRALGISAPIFEFNIKKDFK
jgi:hypothetical protein